MKSKDVTLYILVTVLLLWWIFGTHVTATVTVPQEEIRVGIPTAGSSATGSAAEVDAYIDLVNSLPEDPFFG